MSAMQHAAKRMPRRQRKSPDAIHQWWIARGEARWRGRRKRDGGGSERVAASELRIHRVENCHRARARPRQRIRHWQSGSGGGGEDCDEQDRETRFARHWWMWRNVVVAARAVRGGAVSEGDDARSMRACTCPGPRGAGGVRRPRSQ